MSQIDLMEEAVPAKAENRKRKDLVALAEILGTVDLPVSHTAARLADDFPVPNRRKPVRAVAAPQVLRVHPGGFAEHARRKLGITDPAGLADFDLAGHER